MKRKIFSPLKHFSCRSKRNTNINIWSKINRAFYLYAIYAFAVRYIYKTSKPFFFCKSLPNWAFREFPVCIRMLRLRKYKHILTHTHTHYPTELSWSYIFLFIQAFFFSKEKHYFAFHPFFTHNFFPPSEWKGKA